VRAGPAGQPARCSAALPAAAAWATFRSAISRLTSSKRSRESGSARANSIATTDGRVLFVEEANEDDSYFDLGPEDASPPNIPSPSQVYDPATGRFVELRLMNPFLSFSLTVLRDGRVLILDDSDAALVCSP